MRISDWSSDVCSSDLVGARAARGNRHFGLRGKEYGYERYFGAGRDARALVDDHVGLDVCDAHPGDAAREIGRASCRERVCQYVEISVVDVSLKPKRMITRPQYRSRHDGYDMYL